MSATLLSLAVFTLFCMHKAPHPIKLPAPTGPFAVGTTEYHLIDKNRKERGSPNPQDYRELMVHVWYPADKDTKGEPYPYLSQIMPHVKKIIFETTDTASLEQLKYLDAPIKTHSFYNAPISNAQPTYPVLIFSHGMGTTVARLYTSILEDLASHGYIVVGIDHTYSNLVSIFPGNRVVKFEIPEEDKSGIIGVPDECPIDEAKRLEGETAGLNSWVQDVQFVLDQLEKINKCDPQQLFTSKFDFSRIGIFGHSWGGATAAQMCRIDSRCKAGINIDGSLRGTDAEIPFNKPFMILLGSKTFELGNYPPEKMLAQMKMTKSEFDKLCASMREPTLRSFENLFNNLTNDAYLIFLKNATHGTFSDYPFLLPKLEPDVIAPLKGIEITRKLVVDFFDVYLKNKDRSQFIKMIEQMPELSVKVKTKI